VPVVPTLMGWGAIPDDHRLMAGMAGIQTAHRYGNASLLASDFVLGIGNRWANRHTGGLEKYRTGRTFVHVDIEPTQIGKIFTPDYGVVSDARAALRQLAAVARQRGSVDRTAWVEECLRRKETLHRRTDFDDVPIKPQRVYLKVAEGFGCKALRVREPAELPAAFEEAQKLMAEFRVPVVVEVILERVTNIAMGADLDGVVEFEETADHEVSSPAA
jgi:glyoxylate carboligase